MTGKVKWFDGTKGYGFILCDDGSELFVHYSGIIAEGYRALSEGQNVEFETESDPKGRHAVNVKVIRNSDK